MPIPKPNQNEKESEFISRFMADPVMVKDYPDQGQRSAIAYQTWKDKDKKHDSTSPRTLTFHLDESRADKFQTTPEGYLVCPARPTRAGIFDYYKDGKLFRELRPREEVFKQESLDSLKLLPVTYDHQGRLITVDNIKDHQVGMTGEKVSRDGDFVACTIKLTDKTIIDNVQSRRRAGIPVELSCGYDADMETISGDHPTEGHYDAVQKNIKYNHVSIVDQGRAGSGARLILDNAQKGGNKLPTKFKRKGIKLDSFSMDEINVEIPDGAEGIVDRLSIKLDEATEVIQAQSAKLAESQKKLDESKAEVEKQKDATKKLDAVQAKLDQTTEQLTKATAEVTELTNMDSARVQGMLAAKTTMESAADKLKVDRKDKAPKDIKIAIIKAISPDFKEDGKSDDYINARYDSVLDVIKATETNANNSALGTFIRGAHTDSGPKDPRAEFIAKSQAYGKGGTA